MRKWKIVAGASVAAVALTAWAMATSAASADEVSTGNNPPAVSQNGGEELDGIGLNGAPGGYADNSNGDVTGFGAH